MTKYKVQKYQKEFQEIMFKEMDSLFPENKSKERDKALTLVTVIGIKFQKVLDKVQELKENG